MRPGFAILLVAGSASAHPPSGVQAAPTTAPSATKARSPARSAAIPPAPTATGAPPTAAPPGAPSGPATSEPRFGRAEVSLSELQAVLRRDRLDGWLLTDHDGDDPIALEVVRPRSAPTRRWFYLIPRDGPPVGLYFRGDAPAFEPVPGTSRTWASTVELDRGLRTLLSGRRALLMNYAPRGTIPSLSRVDAGTMEQVRSLGARVFSSGELVTMACARWSEPQRASHTFAAHQLARVKEAAFRWIAAAQAAGARLGEWELAERIAGDLAARGLEAELPPSVAVDVHTADPVFHTAAATSAELREGSLVRIDLTVRQAGVPDATPVEATWIGVVAPRAGAVPDAWKKSWAAVRDARDRAIELVRQRRAKRQSVRGFEVSAVARAALREAGLDGRMAHPIGASLVSPGAGDGPALDDLESHDDRALLPRTGYVLAPGVYFPGEFGMRTAVDLYVTEAGVELTLGPPQAELELIGGVGAPAASTPIAASVPPPAAAPLAPPPPALTPPAATPAPAKVASPAPSPARAEEVVAPVGPAAARGAAKGARPGAAARRSAVAKPAPPAPAPTPAVPTAPPVAPERPARLGEPLSPW